MATYQITFGASGYKNKTVTASPQTTTINLEASDPTTTVTITDCKLSTPISGATLGPITNNNPYVTNANGQFTFEDCDDIQACSGNSLIQFQAIQTYGSIPGSGATYGFLIPKYYGINGTITPQTSGVTCTISPSAISTRVWRPSGSTEVVEVEIPANPNTTPRTVKFYATGYNYAGNIVSSTTLSYIQDGGSSNFSVSPTSLSFTSAGGQEDIAIYAPDGQYWSITGLPTWLSASATDGSGTATVTLTAASGSTSRDTQFTVTDITDDYEIMIEAEQSGASFSVSPTTGTIASGGGTVVLTVSAPGNQHWAIEGAASWLTFRVQGVVTTTGQGNASITVIAPSYAGGRTSTFGIRDTDNNISVTIEITQSADTTPYLYFTPSNAMVDKKCMTSFCSNGYYTDEAFVSELSNYDAADGDRLVTFADAGGRYIECGSDIPYTLEGSTDPISLPASDIGTTKTFWVYVTFANGSVCSYAKYSFSCQITAGHNSVLLPWIDTSGSYSTGSC